jgi:hypothetical protein
MSTEQEPTSLLNETLRKMGRNLLNYQIVEKIWKAQYKVSNIETMFENGEARIINKPVIRRNIPMGWLSENHRKAIFSSPKEHEPIEEINHPSIKTSFRVGEGGTLSIDRKQQVNMLVKERNELVHSISEKFDHSTGVGCREICAILDEQNIRILEEIAFLNTISSSYKETILELQKYLNSEEFISAIENQFLTSR